MTRENRAAAVAIIEVKMTLTPSSETDMSEWQPKESTMYQGAFNEGSRTGATYVRYEIERAGAPGSSALGAL